MMNSTSRIVDNRKQYYAKMPVTLDPEGFLRRYTTGTALQLKWAKERRAKASSESRLDSR